MSERKDRDELIRQAIETHHLHPVDAAEIVDISEGWSDGDVIDEPEPHPDDEPTPSRDDAAQGQSRDGRPAGG